MSPKVTIVIAAYNAELFLKETLDSVFAQNLREIELVVVDDGSTDGTAAILQSVRDPRLVILRQENCGVSAARNAGLAIARAPYVFFLDADDLLMKEALSRMVELLDQMPDHVACFGHHIKIGQDGSELTNRDDLAWRLFPNNDTLWHLIAKNFIVCGAICIRTEIARKVGGFNTALNFGEDWDFWCRLALHGNFAIMPDEIVLLYRQRANSANHRLRRSVLNPNYCAIKAVYSNAEIQRRFSAMGLRRRRRLAEIDTFWAGARNEYMRRRYLRFLTYLVVGILKYPDSVLRPRLVYLFVRSLYRRVGMVQSH